METTEVFEESVGIRGFHAYYALRVAEGSEVFQMLE
jgi:hypothetical protein